MAKVSDARVHPGVAEGSEVNSRDGGGIESKEFIF